MCRTSSRTDSLSLHREDSEPRGDAAVAVQRYAPYARGQTYVMREAEAPAEQKKDIFTDLLVMTAEHNRIVAERDEKVSDLEQQVQVLGEDNATQAERIAVLTRTNEQAEQDHAIAAAAADEQSRELESRCAALQIELEAGNIEELVLPLRETILLQKKELDEANEIIAWHLEADALSRTELSQEGDSPLPAHEHPRLRFAAAVRGSRAKDSCHVAKLASLCSPACSLVHSGAPSAASHAERDVHSGTRGPDH